MSMSASRVVLRQTKLSGGRLAARRFESTTTTTANKATEVAKETTAKASQTATEYKTKAAEGLSKVTSSAGPALSNAAQGASRALGKIGGRTGKVIAFIEKQIPPTIYYARVGLELSKLVFQGQKMTPPSISTFQSYYQGLIQRLRTPSSLLSAGAFKVGNAEPASLLDQARNISTAQMVGGAVIVAELVGFFTVGEMVGRLKLVGYHGETGSHH